MDFIERIEKLREAGDVRRFHVKRGINQTDGQHVYGTLILAVELCRQNNIVGHRAWCVLMTLLYHDTPELEQGDVPAPVKRDYPVVREALEKMEVEFYATLGIGMPELLPEEQHIVKACDTLDLMWKCLDTLRDGNRHRGLMSMMRNVSEWIKTQYAIIGVQPIADYLKYEWDALGGPRLP